MPGQPLAPIDIARDVFRQVRQYERILQCPDLSTLTPGSTSQVILPTGETYRWLDFDLFVGSAKATKAQIKSDILSLQCIIDGDPMIDITGEEAVMLMEYYQTKNALDPVGDLGHLFLPLARPWHREISGEDDPAWGTRDVRTFTVKMLLDGGADIDGCTLYRGVTDGENMGRHVTMRRKPRTMSAAGRERINDWQRDIGTSMLAMHVKSDGDPGMTAVKLTVDNVVEIDCLYTLLARRGIQYGRLEGTTYQHIDFALRNRLQDGVPMVAQTMNLDVTWNNAPGAYDWLIEAIEGPVNAA